MTSTFNPIPGLDEPLCELLSWTEERFEKDYGEFGYTWALVLLEYEVLRAARGEPLASEHYVRSAEEEADATEPGAFHSVARRVELAQVYLMRGEIERAKEQLKLAEKALALIPEKEYQYPNVPEARAAYYLAIGDWESLRDPLDDCLRKEQARGLGELSAVLASCGAVASLREFKREVLLLALDPYSPNPMKAVLFTVLSWGSLFHDRELKTLRRELTGLALELDRELLSEGQPVVQFQGANWSRVKPGLQVELDFLTSARLTVGTARVLLVALRRLLDYFGDCLEGEAKLPAELRAGSKASAARLLRAEGARLDVVFRFSGEEIAIHTAPFWDAIWKVAVEHLNVQYDLKAEGALAIERG